MYPLGSIRSGRKWRFAVALLAICCRGAAASSDVFVEILHEQGRLRWSIGYQSSGVEQISNSKNLVKNLQYEIVKSDQLGQFDTTLAAVADSAVAAVRRSCAEKSVREITLEREMLKYKWDPVLFYFAPNHTLSAYKTYGGQFLLFERKNRRFDAKFCLGAHDLAFSPVGERIAFTYRLDGNAAAIKDADSLLVYDEKKRAVAGKYQVQNEFVVEALRWSEDGSVLAVVISRTVSRRMSISGFFLMVAGHPREHREYKILFLTESLGLISSIDFPGIYVNSYARFVGEDSDPAGARSE
jgi:hypothetical protein